MKVLSLFDGCSSGLQALKELGVPVTTYYASEIDKYAIMVSKANHPEIIQLGDVTKWRQWCIPWNEIDLVIGGSPCQGLSLAGKGLGLDDPRSALFFEYVNIVMLVRRLNPDAKFMLENVRAKKETLNLMSAFMGVQPVFIDSVLTSAQSRKRFYWSNNSGTCPQPADKGIMLQDVLQKELRLEDVTMMSDAFCSRNKNILRDDFQGKAKSLSALEYVKTADKVIILSAQCR